MLVLGAWNLGQAEWEPSEKRPRFQNGVWFAHAQSAIDFESSRTKDEYSRAEGARNRWQMAGWKTNQA